jgi:hypothetical protein
MDSILDLSRCFSSTMGRALKADNMVGEEVAGKSFH